VFQDGSVKTILAKSHKASSGRTPAGILTLEGKPTRSSKASAGARPHFASKGYPNLSLPLVKNLALAVLPPSKVRRRTRISLRINFYRFLLNDFKSFDPLFKVLFIFPSQYLFAIGFPYIFSLRRSLSPA
jgi:hypothetical protein